MILQSTHTPKQYKEAMKQRMGSRFALWSERFTGIFLGRIFYVTHHAGYEWDRRITNQKNAALGFIKATENGSEVRFLLFQSIFCPQYFLLYLLICGGSVLGSLPAFRDLPFLIFFLLGIVIVTPILVASLESLTEGSVEGRKCLLGLLADPADLFAYLNRRKDLL